MLIGNVGCMSDRFWDDSRCLEFRANRLYTERGVCHRFDFALIERNRKCLLSIISRRGNAQPVDGGMANAELNSARTVRST